MPEREISLSLSFFFFKHPAHFVRSHWWKTTSTGTKFVDYPSDTFTSLVDGSLQPPLWYCAPQHSSPWKPELLPELLSRGRKMPGRGRGWCQPPREVRAEQQGVWSPAGPMLSEGPERGPCVFPVTIWVWEWTLAPREWAVPKWLFFGNATLLISSMWNLRYMFLVIGKIK